MEQRLIDANALIEDFEWCKGQAAECNRDEWDSLIMRVSAQPTVDAVPVCRCGRCEYYSNEMNCCLYVNGLQNVTKTDYCSYGQCADGERRSE